MDIKGVVEGKFDMQGVCERSVSLTLKPNFGVEAFNHAERGPRGGAVRFPIYEMRTLKSKVAAKIDGQANVRNALLVDFVFSVQR